ncbi:hypothetical protein MANES_12G088138v8 [Manihot esculenta]|uniref:Uncharacterized protein n=1 Tax=Manihot esculenta TaxID=3983 RepID=A0ACB7GRA7_MANES|nr:hypothetical protein MANES_12G088138v8 [Manihot esculenta]
MLPFDLALSLHHLLLCLSGLFLGPSVVSWKTKNRIQLVVRLWRKSTIIWHLRYVRYNGLFTFFEGVS